MLSEIWGLVAGVILMAAIISFAILWFREEERYWDAKERWAAQLAEQEALERERKGQRA